MMNRFRRLRGANSYESELGADPLALLPPGGAWLDVGCGNGVAVREAARARPDVTIVAMDLEPGFVAPATPPNLAFFQGDAARLPLDGPRFDLVTAVHVLHFIDDKQAALAAWAALRKPGAPLYANLDPHDVWRGEGWADAARETGAQLVLRAPVVWGTFLSARDAAGTNRQGVRSRQSLYRSPGRV